MLGFLFFMITLIAYPFVVKKDERHLPLIIIYFGLCTILTPFIGILVWKKVLCR